MNRMNREEFFAKLAGLDEERLRKALWNLYWRGAVPVRERIEAEIAPAPPASRARPRDEVPDPARVCEEVREFVALARVGSYLSGDRRVSPKERTRWRFTFRRLADEAQAALAAPESRPIGAVAARWEDGLSPEVIGAVADLAAAICESTVL
jgi:hypothetical protein